MTPDLSALSRILLAALDAHEDATEGRELADGVYADAYHPDHADAVYEAKSALRSALNATPGEDPAPHPAGASDAAMGGASGVGVLTNCDSCAYFEGQVRPGCARLLPFGEEESADIRAWATTNRTNRRPKPGATGCPGWAKREGA